MVWVEVTWSPYYSVHYQYYRCAVMWITSENACAYMHRYNVIQVMENVLHHCMCQRPSPVYALLSCTTGGLRQHGCEVGGVSHQVDQRVRGHPKAKHAVASRVWISDFEVEV